MFDISTLALKTTSTEVQFRHPVSNELLWADDDKTVPVSVNLFGTASKEYRDARSAMQNRQLKRGKTKPSAELLNEEGVTLLVATIDHFNNLAVDAAGTVPSTEADFRKLLNDARFSWVRDQIDEALADNERFLDQ